MPLLIVGKLKSPANPAHGCASVCYLQVYMSTRAFAAFAQAKGDLSAKVTGQDLHVHC